MTTTTDIKNAINPRLLTVSLFACLGIATCGLAACNTTEGVGEDMEDTGEFIDEEAEEAQY
jgi:predicted small secreted protein